MIAEPRVFLPIPTGAYPARIQSVEQVEGQYGPQWKWTFDLGNVENVDGEIEPNKTLTYYTQNYITGANKLGKMLTALGIPIDEPLDSSTIIGRTVTLTVTEAPRKDGTIGNNIEAVLPPRKKKTTNGTAPAPVPAQPVLAEEDDDEIPF